MSPLQNVVVPTGTANLASVVAAFERLGVDLVPTTSPEVILRSTRVVVPGVGTFASAVDRLRSDGLMGLLRSRIEADRPTLAICVGMQILALSSEESPQARGMGIIKTEVKRFSGDVIVPQMSWNEVRPGSHSRFIEPGWAYFANSYYLPGVPSPWVPSLADYGTPLIAAFEHGNVLACQFHPEISGTWGAEVLDRWVAQTGDRS